MPKSSLNSASAKCLSSILLLVFLMAWTEHWRVRDAEDDNPGSSRCHARATFISLFRKCRWTTSDWRTDTKKITFKHKNTSQSLESSCHFQCRTGRQFSLKTSNFASYNGLPLSKKKLEIIEENGNVTLTKPVSFSEISGDQTQSLKESKHCSKYSQLLRNNHRSEEALTIWRSFISEHKCLKTKNCNMLCVKLTFFI